MFAHAIARALDLDHDGVMEQPIEQRGCNDRIAERFVMPFFSMGLYVVRPAIL